MSLVLPAFVAATLLWTLVALVLSFRQIRHVRRHRDAVPASFSASVSLADHQKAADYTVAREQLAILDTLLDTALTLAWVFGGIGLLHAGLAAVLPGNALVLGVAFLIGTAVVQTFVGLPLSLYRTFAIEQRFGFNRTTPATFLADRLKGWALSLALGIPLLTAALLLMRVGGLWWLWVWAGLMVLMIVAPAFYVRVIAPRFNRFTPLEEGPLRARIERLLTASGFRSSGLFTMDASRRTAHGNAYFIGFGQAKRIVLFDTLLADSPPEEVEAVIAHELGHFRHHHVLFGLLRGAAISLALLAGFGWLCKQPWLLPAFGLPSVDDALALFVCGLLASVVGPLIAPLSNWISRRNEFQADDYARRAVGAAPMIGALTRLARDNAATLTPDPLYALAHFSHPPVPVRVQHLGARQEPATA
jgi:STE24 endopeptidase